MKKAALLFLFLTTAATSLQAHPYHRHRATRGARAVVVVPAVGVVDINCNRDRAKVYIDGKYRGLAGDFDGRPGKLQLSAGSHRVQIDWRGSCYTSTIKVHAGRETNVNVHF